MVETRAVEQVVSFIMQEFKRQSDFWLWTKIPSYVAATMMLDPAELYGMLAGGLENAVLVTSAEEQSSGRAIIVIESLMNLT